MEVVQHLGHDHPLMLIKKEETEDSWDLTCYGCKQAISDSYFSDYYGCKRCQFFLDKTCSELPPEMIYSFHPHHPLTLIPAAPSMTDKCDVCRGDCYTFLYRCSLCDYNLDIRCASQVLSVRQSINHKSHAHQLISLQRESMFLCDACGEEHKGSSFLCTICGFWINQKCASSPLTIKLIDHHHTLLLIYVISEEDYLRCLPRCEICRQIIYRKNWIYRCSACRYFSVHMRCVASRKVHSTDYETETESHDLFVTVAMNAELSKFHTTKDKAKALDPNPICFPVPTDYADSITQFIKNFRIQGKYGEAAEIKHVSHDHPLTFFEKPIEHASSSKGNYLTLLNRTKSNEKCRGCAQNISDPFYGCIQCNFFLHVWCAELQEELRHPGHPGHTLFLSTCFDFCDCTCCDIFGDILHYRCGNCTFVIDCKCASVPQVIHHKSHKHNLALRPTDNMNTCISCRIPFILSFECRGCKFNLCVNCALLPGTIQHRYDENPFNLTYSPLPYEREDDFCEICEQGIDSKYWFYHCGKCDQSVHTTCIFPDYVYSNMVHGDVFEGDWHPHPLTCVRVQFINGFSCSLCKGERKYPAVNQTVYVCSQCKFGICYFCFWGHVE